MAWTGQRVKRLALLEAALLGFMVLLSGSSRPPLVAIGDMGSLEAGTRVTVVGLLAENWLYESGSEGLLLACQSSSETLRVICTRGSLPLPSEYAAIGDELSVKGEVSRGAAGTCLMATSDDVERLRPSATALTVEMLCENWMVFLNDQVSVRGVILADDATTAWRLADAHSGRSVSLCLRDNPSILPGSVVEAVGELVLEQDRMDIVFITYSLRAAH
jgi:hypothetical protein